MFKEKETNELRKKQEIERSVPMCWIYNEP